MFGSYLAQNQHIAAERRRQSVGSVLCPRTTSSTRSRNVPRGTNTDSGLSESSDPTCRSAASWTRCFADPGNGSRFRNFRKRSCGRKKTANASVKNPEFVLGRSGRVGLGLGVKEKEIPLMRKESKKRKRRRMKERFRIFVICRGRGNVVGGRRRRRTKTRMQMTTTTSSISEVPRRTKASLR